MTAAIDYSDFGKILVKGNDAEQVLQNILTQDIKTLTSGNHCPAALLTHTGKILLYMEVYRFDGYFILVLDNTPASKGLLLIDKFIITEDVTLQDATERYAYFQIFSSPASDMKVGELYPVKPGEYLLSPMAEKEAVIKNHGLMITEGEEAEKLRISAGVPRYGVDMDETTILSEAGLNDVAVSETKGCYPGQEVIARIKTYSSLKRKLTIKRSSIGTYLLTYMDTHSGN